MTLLPTLTRTAAVVALALTAAFLLAHRGEARSLFCKEYETTVLTGSGAPLKAVGKVCQAGGKWYLVGFTASELAR